MALRILRCALEQRLLSVEHPSVWCLFSLLPCDCLDLSAAENTSVINRYKQADERSQGERTMEERTNEQAGKRAKEQMSSEMRSGEITNE